MQGLFWREVGAFQRKLWQSRHREQNTCRRCYGLAWRRISVSCHLQWAYLLAFGIAKGLRGSGPACPARRWRACTGRISPSSSSAFSRGRTYDWNNR